MHTTPIPFGLLRGALDLEPTEVGVLPHRLPAWARAQYDDPQLEMVESQPSGVRLAFETRATAVELETRPTKRVYTGAHGFLDTIRDGHPTTPLLVVSPVLCPMHEDTPGPTMWDLEALSRGELRFQATGDPAGDPADVPAGKLTLNVIREELARIVAQRDDPNLHYLDGRELYGAADSPLPDDLHPDGPSHQRMAERFAKLAFGGPFRVSSGRGR